MTSITLTQQTAQSTRPSNYLLNITVTSSNNIDSHIFVKQRIVRADGTFDDTFYTVASPTEMEDLPYSSPNQGNMFFRDSAISLISEDPTLLTDISTHIYSDIQILCQQTDDLSTLSTPETVTINGSSITVSP